MAEISPDNFEGFTTDTLVFLKELAENNNKAWFENHRGEYQEHLLRPFQLLVSELSELMLSIDPQFETRPAIDKTLSRIYRDTRFAKDKSPYRPRMWLSFKRLSKDWKTAPAYFFELSQDGYRYGMGFYGATRETMERLREMIDEEAREFWKAMVQYRGQDVFHLEGEQYKRVRDPEKPDYLQDWYQRKNIFLICNCEIDQRLFSRELVEELARGFLQLVPLYRFFRNLVDSE
ncbi:DUF2461 domain-containing protein [Candidatus Neomarinimicrobiota bacterium]